MVWDRFWSNCVWAVVRPPRQDSSQCLLPNDGPQAICRIKNPPLLKNVQNIFSLFPLHIFSFKSITMTYLTPPHFTLELFSVVKEKKSEKFRSFKYLFAPRIPKKIKDAKSFPSKMSFLLFLGNSR